MSTLKLCLDQENMAMNCLLTEGMEFWPMLTFLEEVTYREMLILMMMKTGLRLNLLENSCYKLSHISWGIVWDWDIQVCEDLSCILLTQDGTQTLNYTRMISYVFRRSMGSQEMDQLSRLHCQVQHTSLTYKIPHIQCQALQTFQIPPVQP